MLGGIVIEYLRPSLAKIYRHSGFDFIFIDKEHRISRGCQFFEVVDELSLIRSGASEIVDLNDDVLPGFS